MKYFYLNSYERTASWSISKPDDCMIFGEIVWNCKNKYNISICSDNKFYELNEKSERIIPSQKFRTDHLPILKSNLQKCVRRKKIDIGMKTSVSMSKIIDNYGDQVGLFELLRRMTIIVIEDALLFYEYNLLVWFLCVMTKKLVVRTYTLSWILEIINSVIGSKWQDKTYLHTSCEKFDTGEYVEKILKSNITHDKKNLLLSILFRNSFGGMKCDVIMLNNSVVVWLNRFMKGEDILIIEEMNYFFPLEKCSYDELDADDILDEAIDFHCSNICDRIRKYVDIKEEYLKKLIWDYSSSINVRDNISKSASNNEYNNKHNKKNIEKWKVIMPIFLICSNEIKNILFIE